MELLTVPTAEQLHWKLNALFDASFEKVVRSQSSFCLEMESDSFKHDHPYSCQVQLQIKICQVDYCDFVVWREDNIFVQSISINLEFIDDAIEDV